MLGLFSLARRYRRVLGPDPRAMMILRAVALLGALAPTVVADPPRNAGAVFCDPTIQWNPDDPQCPSGASCPDPGCTDGTSTGLCRCRCPLPYIMERLQAVGRICCAGSDRCMNSFHPRVNPHQFSPEDPCAPTVT